MDELCTCADLIDEPCRACAEPQTEPQRTPGATLARWQSPDGTTTVAWTRGTDIERHWTGVELDGATRTHTTGDSANYMRNEIAQLHALGWRDLLGG